MFLIVWHDTPRAMAHSQEHMTKPTAQHVDNPTCIHNAAQDRNSFALSPSAIDKLIGEIFFYTVVH